MLLNIIDNRSIRSYPMTMKSCQKCNPTFLVNIDPCVVESFGLFYSHNVICIIVICKGDRKKFSDLALCDDDTREKKSY